MYRAKRIGDTGEPCARPHRRGDAGVVTSWNRIAAERSCMKEPAHLTRYGGHPCCRSRRISRLRMTVSKAPCTSIVTSVATWPLARAVSISCTRAATRSTADLFGRAPICCGCRIPYRIEAQARRRAISLSSPLPRHESSDIGLQARVLERSRLPGFSIMTTSASLNLIGW